MSKPGGEEITNSWQGVVSQCDDLAAVVPNGLTSYLWDFKMGVLRLQRFMDNIMRNNMYSLYIIVLPQVSGMQ